MVPASVADDELGRHALVHDVDDGTGDRAQLAPRPARLGDDAQLLGPYRERDLVAEADRAVGGGGDEETVAGRGRDLEEIAGPAGDLGLDDVRRPDEAGDEAGGRPLVDVFGEADLLDLPCDITAMRSLITSASSWSCVT